MPITISGKRVIVTGGARGIGADTVHHLVAEGGAVASFDILDQPGSAVAEDASREAQGTVTYWHVDVTDETEVHAAVDAAVEELGGLDALVNVAGIDEITMPEDMTDTAWDRLLDVNVKGVAHMCQAAFSHLKDRGGSIVNIGSDVGLMHGPPTNSAYGATKGAIISYTRILASAWGSYGIRANVVNPLIRTPLYDEFLAALDPDQTAAFEAQLTATVPLGGTLGHGPTDLAPVLAFLISDAARFITAQIIGVNGGFNPGR